jgi:hypothetical protein
MLPPILLIAWTANAILSKLKKPVLAAASSLGIDVFCCQWLALYGFLSSYKAIETAVLWDKP